MKITLTSHGTRGDVQPYLTLAVGLQKAGHRVTLVTSYNYTGWIESYGVRTHPTQYSVQEWMKKPDTQALFKGRNFIKQMSSFMRFMATEGPKAMEEVWASIAQEDEYMRQIGIPALNGFSEHVLPRPADWYENQHITGYWFLETPTNWQPDSALLQFLESGPPPVYVGFGSMAVGDPEYKTQLILKALEMSGQRGVVLTGWGGLSRQTAHPNNPAPVGLSNPAEAGIWQSPQSNLPSIFFVDDVPHSWLFPRMAALGKKIRAENGVARAVEIIERYANSFQRK